MNLSYKEAVNLGADPPEDPEDAPDEVCIECRADYAAHKLHGLCRDCAQANGWACD